MTEPTLFPSLEPVPSGAGPAGAAPVPAEVGFLPFHGADIPILVNEAGNWPSVTALSNRMGVDPEGQRQAIVRKHWAEGWTCKTQVQMPGDTQRREHFFIHEKRVPMWLANIDTTRLKDTEVRARVEATQVEFADVLAEWAATGEVKPTSPAANSLELPMDYETALVHLLASVRERKALEAARAAEAPLVEQARHHRSTRALTAVGDFANDLQAWVRDEGINATVYHDDVRDFLGYLKLIIRGSTVRNNCPQSEAIKAGYVRPHNHDYGTSARLTRKGVGYVWDRITPHIKATGSAKPPTKEEGAA